MQESLSVFGQMHMSKLFNPLRCVLLLTKLDLLENALKRTPLNSTFPDYNGPNSVDSCLQYIQSLYLAKINRETTILTIAVSTVDELGMRDALFKIRDFLTPIDS